MKSKQIASISDLPEESFFDEVSLGYEKILKNALQLDEDASLLKADRRPSCRILSKIAEEEAAKCLILLDAVRCPRNLLKSHLSKFSKHIDKGVYAEACYWSPRDFEEFKIYVEDEKKKNFIDGPSGVEYVFENNRIVWDREENMYVE